MLRIRGGVREEELPRGGAFLPTVRSGRLAVGNGAESSQKGPAHFRISDHVTTVTAEAQSHPEYKAAAERRLRRRGAQRTPAKHQNGSDDYENENVQPGSRE